MRRAVTPTDGLNTSSTNVYTPIHDAARRFRHRYIVQQVIVLSVQSEVPVLRLSLRNLALHEKKVCLACLLTYSA